MGTGKQRRGGVRKGAGRPKKKSSELQHTHSIRATDKDWKDIQIVVRTIKACQTKKKPRLFFLDDAEYKKVNKILMDDFIEDHHIQKWGIPEEAPQPPQNEAKVDLQTPKTTSEEEAVSVFLEYFRLNPEEAILIARNKLEHEQNKRRQKEIREEQEKVMGRLQKRAQIVLDDIDAINERISNLLKFPGYRKPASPS